jgi:hypothetical protein
LIGLQNQEILESDTKNRPISLGRLLFLLPGVLFSIRHNPDQAYHKRALLRKKEDNNQANDNFEHLYEIHFGFLSKLTKNRPVGRLVFL